MFPATLLSRFMQSPSQIHLGVAKRVLRYSKWSLDYYRILKLKVDFFEDIQIVIGQAALMIPRALQVMFSLSVVVFFYGIQRKKMW